MINETRNSLIIITGTTRGLGEAIVDYIIESTNLKILAISRSLNKKQLNYSKNRFHFLELDLNNVNNICIKINSKKELFDHVDTITLINNAGVISPINLIGSFNEDEIVRSVNINAIAPILITNYLLSNYSDKKLNFINISSGAAHKEIAGWAAYCAAKAYTSMFYKVLKEENRTNTKIRVFQFDPGVLDTDMQMEIRNSDYKVFPKHQEFVALKNENKLLKAEIVAENIIKEVIFS